MSGCMEHWKTDMSREIDSSIPIPEQAAQWWVILHSEGATGADHREFGEWVARSPERVEAYLQTARLVHALKSPTVRWPTTPAEQLIREAKQAPPEPLQLLNRGTGVAPLPPPSPPSARWAAAEDSGAVPAGDRRSWRWPLRGRVAWGAAAAALAVCAVTWSYLTGPQVYQTHFGEQRSILLEDGSRITLNTASRIDVRFDKGQRFVRLLQGEALFEVAHDATRPFDVQTGATVLRALGTQFDVEMGPNLTTVTVVEGRVAVVPKSMVLTGDNSGALPWSSAGTNGHAAAGTAADPTPAPIPAGALILAAAERVVITTTGTSTPQHLPNAVTATSWTQRQLVFEDRPLMEVAEEFNRYNRERIVIDSPELREQHVTGVFRSNDPAAFLAFLSGLPGVEVSQAGDGNIRLVRVRSRMSSVPAAAPGTR
jgi:transmembrane sensor